MTRKNWRRTPFFRFGLLSDMAVRRARLIWCCAVLLTVSPAAAQTKRAEKERPTGDKDSQREKRSTDDKKGPVDFRSQNFLIHTDLAADDAKQLLERLETMLELISAYWGRPLSGLIEGYVVNDLANWPPGSIPQEGLPNIVAGAGVTITKSLSQGVGFVARAVVYSVANQGTPQHEAVHAYCGQTFGTTGPVWYSEGMAEMGKYWCKDDKSVQCYDIVIDYLKSNAPKSLNEIVNGKEFTGDSWQNYAWRWALCHLLANNTNYAAQFRPLGLALLRKEPTSFEQVYGEMASEIMFEYRFFLAHLEQGYRADLCSWDWKKKWRNLKGSATTTATVKADRGWQPSGALVAAGATYQYKATGTWRLGKDQPEHRADGAEDGLGRLVAAVLTTENKDGGQEYVLGEQFELGTEGTFKAPADGKLQFRCRDAWGQLADNQGTMTVKLKARGKK